MGGHQCEIPSSSPDAVRAHIVQVLGTVVDRVLYDATASKDTTLRRAKAILTIGAIFKNVQADESDDERRELERSVFVYFSL